MIIFRPLIPIFILTSLVSCTNTNKTLDSARFYLNFKTEFLRSDLTKYNYDPRGHFTSLYNDTTLFYRVIVLGDSSLRIMGTSSFSKAFNIKIDTFFNSDVILSKLPDSNYILRSLYDEEPLTHIIPQQKSSTNVVEYFLNLVRLLNKFKILEIASHPVINTKKVVFSSNDYLIYKPDSLVFNDSENTDFMNLLFENGKQLDKNWYQFNDKTNTDYQ